jgi:hypothetical protein
MPININVGLINSRTAALPGAQGSTNISTRATACRRSPTRYVAFCTPVVSKLIGFPAIIIHYRRRVAFLTAYLKGSDFRAIRRTMYDCLRSSKTFHEHESYNLDSFDTKSEFSIDKNRLFCDKSTNSSENRLFQIKSQSYATRKPINCGALPKFTSVLLINAACKSPRRYGLNDFKGR